MTSIVKAIATAIAAGLGFGVASVPATHHIAAGKPAGISRIYTQADPDLFTGLRGRLGSGVAPVLPVPAAPDAAPAAEVPAADVPAPDPAVVVSQPFAQLPIAAPRPAAPPAPAPAPAPAIVVGSTQQALINQDRAGAGLGPLTWNSCLAAVAYQNAQRMAAQGYISHANGVNQDLGCGIGSHSGENVGYWSGDINDVQLNTMFMNSAGHRANIMGSYTYVGTAWVVAPDGKAYIAVEFD